MATDVLGRIIEVVSGRPLDAFVEQRITKPLGMESTGFYVREPDSGRLAQPQADASGERPAMPDVTVKPRWFSGGGGMVSTPADYLRFAQMMLNGGTWGGTRYLSPSTVALMASDALPPGVDFSERAKAGTMADLAPMPAAGQGFGLGFAVRTAAGRNPLPGSVGTFYWTGAYGTTFWIDPSEKLIGILMIQAALAETPPYRRALRYLTYQALLNARE
jgi:CubicO group peptidase (beta-lactamase class C family)